MDDRLPRMQAQEVLEARLKLVEEARARGDEETADAELDRARALRDRYR